MKRLTTDRALACNFLFLTTANEIGLRVAFSKNYRNKEKFKSQDTCRALGSML